MALTLPGELVWILDLLGFEWPDANEDDLHACAQAWRDLASEIDRVAPQGSSAANAVTSVNSGDAVDSFRKAWGEFDGSGGGSENYFRDAKAAAEVIALAFDAAALAIITAKVAIIAQLVMLAAEFIAAQAEAVFTFGLSELGGLAATGITRVAVREILNKLRQEVMKAAAKAMEHAAMDEIKKLAKKALSKEGRRLAMNYVKKTVKDEVKDKVVDEGKKFVREKVVEGAKEKAKEAATGVAGNLASQGIEMHFGERHGLDLGETGDVVKEKAGEYVHDVRSGAKDYVDGVESLADPDTYVDKMKDDAIDQGKSHTMHAADSVTNGRASQVTQRVGHANQAYEDARNTFG